MPPAVLLGSSTAHSAMLHLSDSSSGAVPFASRIDVVVTYFASGFLFGPRGTTFQTVLAKCNLFPYVRGDEYKIGSGYQNASQQ